MIDSDVLRTLLTDFLDQPAKVFPQMIVLGLSATGAVLGLHWLVSCLARRGTLQRRIPARWNLWEKLIYTITALSVVGLAATSFYAVLAHGHMAGWILLAHMMWSGVFVGMLAVVAVTWSVACRFGRHAETPDEPSTVPFLWLTKLAFWVFLVGGLIATGSMLLSMLPWLGTQGLTDLLVVHRYSGLVVVVAALVHCYSVWLGRFGLG